MSADLSFAVTYQYPDRPDGITVPVLLSAGGQVIQASAKVDTGAECCIFSQELGLKLGLEIESGLYKQMGSLTGTLDTYGHDVVIQTFGIAFESVVYFAKYPGLRRNLLGRNGWLRHLQLAIIDYENTLHLSQYS